MLSNSPSSPNPLRRVLSRSLFKTPPAPNSPIEPSNPKNVAPAAPKRRLSTRRPSSSRSTSQDDVENLHPRNLPRNPFDHHHQQQQQQFLAHPRLKTSCSEKHQLNRLSLIAESSPNQSRQVQTQHRPRQSRPHTSQSNVKERPSTTFSLFLSNSSFISSSNNQDSIETDRRIPAMSSSTSSRSRPSTPSSLLPAWNEFWNGSHGGEINHLHPRPHKLQRKGSDESFFCRGISNIDGVDDSRVPEGNSLGLTGSSSSHLMPPPRPARPHSFSLFWDDEEAMADRLDFDGYKIDSNGNHMSQHISGSISPTQSLYSLSTVSSSLSLDAFSCPSPTSSCFPSSPKEWFESCPPSPPATIRLKLDFTKTNHPQSTGLLNPEVLLISNSSSILELKELIVKRLSSKGIAFSPNELSLGVQLDNQQPLTTSNLEQQASLTASLSPKSRASALFDKVRGRSSEGASGFSNPSSPTQSTFHPIQLKELDNQRLICEEGLLEDDEVVVCLKTRNFTWI